MSVPVYSTDPLYPGEDQFVEADFSGFAELFGETGATVTCTIVSGSGMTLTGSPSWSHTTKRAQQRVAVSAGGATVLLKWALVTAPTGLDRVGYTYVPLETAPS
ncbi:MAG TPA: hypothetical protein VEI97_08120 [bacterium]|nr:hypothetical protein [bacterium]